MTDKLLYSIEEAASRLDVSRRTLERILASGKLRAVRPNGGHRKIAAAELEAYIRRLSGRPVASNVASSGAEKTPEPVALAVVPRRTMPDAERGLRISQALRAKNVAKRRAGDAV